ncbi:MAG: type II secretion system major pseudopilin GspG [Bdellovibrionota bacterium]
MKRERVLLQNQQGFSLIEILIVMSLIAIAGTFVMNKLFDRMAEGNIKAAQIQISGFKGLLEDYRRYCNQYPTSDQGLEALVSKPTTAPDCPNYPSSGFLGSGSKVPVDPWGTPYVYESDGKTVLITSYGADRKADGEGYDKDIKSSDQ